MLDRNETMKRPLNIAHRGGAGLWPENTLLALREASRAGFDGAEIDVQMTRDGALVVFHDFALTPQLCRDGEGRWLKRRRGEPLPLIRALTLSQLKAFDVGRVKPRSVYARLRKPLHSQDGERIPLLSEAIASIKGFRKDFRLFIEIKTSYDDRSLSAAPEEVADAVIEELRHARFLHHAVLVGFDWPALIHAKKLEHALPCWFTTRKRRRGRAPAPWAGGFDPRKFGGSIPKAIAAAGGQGWLCSRWQATPRAFASARECGLQFGVWTVNEKPAMRRFNRLGVDAIITDRPDRLASLL